MRIINKNLGNKYFYSLKNTEAFTLVELIIVAAIISIVSIFSFGSFSDFASKQAAGEDLSNLNQIIRDFDYQIRKMNIYDYRMLLET
jgi:prepilin-type N-terminal cleavage/methylation domain-containing protein